jgi:hypothetical protein
MCKDQSHAYLTLLPHLTPKLVSFLHPVSSLHPVLCCCPLLAGRTSKNVVLLSNVTLYVPAAEFSFIRSHTAEQPTSFTINLQGECSRAAAAAAGGSSRESEVLRRWGAACCAWTACLQREQLVVASPL